MGVIIVTPTRGGFGAGRLLVNPNGRLTEPALHALRPAVDSLPERLPLPFVFPDPAKRGASRPTPVFPPPTPNRFDQAQNISQSQLPQSATGPSGLAQCVDGGGIWAPFGTNVNAGATTVQVFGPISFPGIITVIRYASDLAPNVGFNAAFRIKVAQDNDTSGGIATSGTLIQPPGSTTGAVGAGSQPHEVYPNVVVPLTNWFIKGIFVNSSAGTVHFLMDISVTPYQ